MTDDFLVYWIFGSIFLPIVVAVVGLSLGRQNSRGHFLWYFLPGLVNAILHQVGDELGIPVLSWASSGIHNTAILSVFGALYVLGLTMPIVFAYGYRIVTAVASAIILILSYPSVLTVMCAIDDSSCL